MENNCRKCLLKDISSYYDSIYEYIKNIPEHLKADDELYALRLKKCSECDNLLNGMCRLCGCFVEVRAAKKISRCAKSGSVW